MWAMWCCAATRNLTYKDSCDSTRGCMQVLLAAVLYGGVVRTSTRIPDWHDEGTLFESAVAVCPNSAKIRMQYAKVCCRRVACSRRCRWWYSLFFGCSSYVCCVLPATQLQMNRQNFTGMLHELRTAERIDPDFCDLQHELGLYYLAVRHASSLIGVQRPLRNAPPPCNHPRIPLILRSTLLMHPSFWPLSPFVLAPSAPVFPTQPMQQAPLHCVVGASVL